MDEMTYNGRTPYEMMGHLARTPEGQGIIRDTVYESADVLLVSVEIDGEIKVMESDWVVIICDCPKPRRCNCECHD